MGSVPATGQIGDGRPVPVPGQLEIGPDGDGDGDRGIRALEQSWAPCARVLRLPFNGAMPKPEVPVSKGVRGDDPGDLIY